MTIKFHVRFGSSGGVSNCPADHNWAGHAGTILILNLPLLVVLKILVAVVYLIKLPIMLGIIPTTTGRKTEEKNLTRLSVLNGHTGKRVAML